MRDRNFARLPKFETAKDFCSMTKRPIEPIIKGRVRLRLLDESDLPMTLAWRNQDRVRKWFINSDLITYEQHREWFDNYRTRDDDFVFIVEETRDLLKPIGQVSIYNIDTVERRAEFGRIIIGEPDALLKGLAKEATMLAFHLAFSVLGLNELVAFVKSDNAGSEAALSSAGFGKKDEENGFKRLTALASETKFSLEG